MSTTLLIHLTTDGLESDVNHFLNIFNTQSNRYPIDRIAEITSINLPPISTNIDHLKFFRYTNPNISNNTERVTVSLIDGMCDIKFFNEKFVERISSLFPKLNFKLYLDDYQHQIACYVFNTGILRQKVIIRDKEYFDFMTDDDSYIDSDGLRNYIDSLINQGEGLL